MNTKHFSLAIFLLAFAANLAMPTRAYAWSFTPQKVSFANEQGITLDAWLFQPADSAVHPAVVMMHGCSGIYSFSDPTKGIGSLYLEWGNRLAGAGYVALLVDSFTPRKVAQNLCNTDGTVVSEITDRPYDAYAALSYLAARPNVDAAAIGLLGWSHGASSTLAIMDKTNHASANFKVAVAFYPGCGLHDSFGGLSQSTWQPYAPLVILHGAADTTVSPADCQTRVSKAKTLGATNTNLTIFANAQHSFDLATSVANGFTQDDVNAKLAADQQAMQFFGTQLQNISEATFHSVGAYDGYVLESSETSNLGGSINSTSTQLQVGDDTSNRQYRSLLHFNTSTLPDAAVITGLSLKVKQQCMIGSNPFTVLGSLQADIKKTMFSTSTSLQAGDFQSNASLSNAGKFNPASIGGWYSVTLNSSTFTFVDRAGTIQIRLRLVKDDNNDHLANYVCFYSGNTSTVANRPVLTVLYYVP